MNVILKVLIATGIVASCNLSAWAEEVASTVPSLQDKEGATREAEEASSTAPTLQEEVERLRDMTPKQRAEEQKTLHEAMQKMTPEQRAEKREEMREELDKMSSEERHALHNQRQSEAEKLASKELIEHGGELPQESNTTTTEQHPVEHKKARENKKSKSSKILKSVERDKHSNEDAPTTATHTTDETVSAEKQPFHALTP